MKRFLILPLCSALFLTSVAAQEGGDKSREQLKAVMMQLRTLQTEKASMQAAQADLETKNKTLDELVKKQAKELEAVTAEKKQVEKAAADKQNEQSAAIDRLRSELTRHQTSLEKWQASHALITDIAKKKEVERAKFSAKASDLERQVADLRTRNTELHKVGNEILERYRKMGIGESLAAREPFTGNARVKLQNIVQDYSDTLADQVAVKP